MNGLLYLLCIIWGVNWVIMKEANSAFPPVLFAGYRFGLGALLLLLLCVCKRIPLPGLKDFKWYLLCGLLQTAYFNIAIQLSLQTVNVGLTSVLTYSMPMWLAVMGHFWIPGERLDTRKTVGILTGVIGMFFAMDAHLGGSLWMLLLALSSGLSWALSNLVIKRKLAGCDNLQFTAWQMTAGAIGLFLYSLVFEHGPSHWGVIPVFYIGFTGILGSALAFVIWFKILSGMEAGKASISLLLVPIIGVISGCLFLHETLSVTTVIGIVCVLTGIWLVNAKRKTPAETREIDAIS